MFSFFFSFLFFEDSIDRSSSSEILSQSVSTLLISPSKTFFVLVTLFSISGISFQFRDFQLSAYIALCAYMLSTLSFGALSILIIIVFNSQFDNSNKFAMQVSDTSSVSSHGRISFLSIFLPFSTPCKFLLVVSHDVWIKETTYDRPLVM